MSINIGPPAVEELRPHIAVIGVGGAGGNAIANMINAEVEGVDFIVANTDAQSLNNSIAEHRIQLGPEITQGLGAGARPEVGRAAAEETLEEIERELAGVHMCFIAAGMGGGTGTGAAPVIAKAARDRGILTVGVVTKPFLFEGTRRMRSADAGIDELQKHVDTLIVIPNQNLFLVAKAETTFKEAFQLADEVLQQGVRSITDLMVMPGLINLDFADVRSVMGEMGKAMMGTGEGEGPNRALEAAERAISNPLLDGVSMKGAKGVIISIIGGEDMKLLEVDEAANHIRELVDPNANIIWGSAFNPDLQGKIRVSVVATGIEQTAEQAEEASKPFSVGTSRGPVVRPGAGQQAPAPAAQPSRLPLPPRPVEPVGANSAPANGFNGSAAFADASGGDNTGADRPAVAGSAPAELEEADALDLALELDAGRAESAVPEEPVTVAAQPQLAPAPAYAASTVPSFLDRAPLQPAADPRPAPAPAPFAASAQPAAGSESTRFARGYSPAEAGEKTGGGTLFERMASLSRGNRTPAPADDEDEDNGALNLPRFLGRR